MEEFSRNYRMHILLTLDLGLKIVSLYEAKISETELTHLSCWMVDLSAGV